MRGCIARHGFFLNLSQHLAVWPGGRKGYGRQIELKSGFGTKLTCCDIQLKSAYEAETDMPNNPADFRC